MLVSYQATPMLSASLFWYENLWGRGLWVLHLPSFAGKTWKSPEAIRSLAGNSYALFDDTWTQPWGSGNGGDDNGLLNSSELDIFWKARCDLTMAILFVYLNYSVLEAYVVRVKWVSMEGTEGKKTIGRAWCYRRISFSGIKSGFMMFNYSTDQVVTIKTYPGSQSTNIFGYE